MFCFAQTEGTSARDLMLKYSTGKKTSKNKKKLEKAMKVLTVAQPAQAVFLSNLIISYLIIIHLF